MAAVAAAAVAVAVRAVAAAAAVGQIVAAAGLGVLAAAATAPAVTTARTVATTAAATAVRAEKNHEFVTMRSPSAPGRNHPSPHTKVSVNSGPSHPHDDPGTQTTSHH
jgi:hypothetical protein